MQAAPLFAVAAGAIRASSSTGWAIVVWGVVLGSLVMPPLLSAARFGFWRAALVGSLPGLVTFGLGLASLRSPWGARTAGDSEDWTNAGSVIFIGILGIASSVAGDVLAIPLVLVQRRRSRVQGA